MSETTFGTEAPVPMTDGGVPVLNPSGGVDEARDVQLEAEAKGEVPATESAEATTADAGGTSEPAEVISEGASTEPAPVATEGSTTAPEVVTPTPEEQAEIDSMVDYTITEETLEQFNASRVEGMEPFKVGDVVKLAKDHPIVATPAEGGTPSV